MTQENLSYLKTFDQIAAAEGEIVMKISVKESESEMHTLATVCTKPL